MRSDGNFGAVCAIEVELETQSGCGGSGSGQSSGYLYGLRDR